MRRDEEKQIRKENWEGVKDMTCTNEAHGHDWMPVSWLTSGTTKHVSQLMCKQCFCLLDMNDCYEFGKKHVCR